MATAAKFRSLARTDTLNADETFQLPSPPSSQVNLLDMDFHSMRASSEIPRSLISPPPEEILRHIQSQRSPAQPPFTPSLLANAHGLSSTSKRKRTAPSTTSSTSSVNAPSDPPQVAPNVEGTPNPKPRKQSRRHTRTSSSQSMDSDIDMGSPSTVRQRLKPLRVSSPLLEDGAGEAPEHTPSPQTTPTRAQHTSPIRRSSTPRGSRTISPKTSPGKPHRSYLQSPHATNPDANYIPPISIAPLKFDSANTSKSLRRGRRSVTPIPPYEPPPDVFTPPKIVVLSPQPQTRPRSSSKPRASRTRSATPKTEPGKTKRVTGVLTIKTEMPEIDLTDPAPPASPTDDPLLLSGPIDVPSSSRSRTSVRTRGPDRDEQLRTPVRSKTGKRVTIVLPDIPAYKPRASSSLSPPNPTGASQLEERVTPRISVIPDDLPASSPLPSSDFDDVQGEAPLDIPFDLAETSTDMDVDGNTLPVFAFDPDAGDTGFSDSDEEDLPAASAPPVKKDSFVIGEGEGEYTGRWRLLTVPTKNDPPSSATRERMDKWGRPISPFPKQAQKSSDMTPPFVDNGEEELVARRPSPSVAHPPEQLPTELGHDASAEFADIPEDKSLEYGPAPAGAFDFDVSFEDAAEPDDIPNPGEVEAEAHEDASLEYQPAPAGAFDFDLSFEQVPAPADDVELVEASSKAQEIDGPEEGNSADSHVLRQDIAPLETGGLAEDLQAAFPPGDHDFPDDGGADQHAEGATAEEEQLSTAMDADPPRSPSHHVDTEFIRSSRPTTPGFDLPPSSDLTPSTDFVKPEDDEVPMEVLHAGNQGAEAEQPQATRLEQVHFQPSMEDDMTDEDSGGGSESDEAGDTSLVEITSADPRAAARAAAILKQHDYELYTKIVLQQRQNKGSQRGSSLATVDDIARNSRRRSVSAGGICKSRSPRARSLSRGISPATSRRVTVGGMVGDKVVIPGSPAMTLPELLYEAEEGLRAGSVCSSVSKEMGTLKLAGSPLGKDSYATPCPANRRFPTHLPVPETTNARNNFGRVWTKEDWKRLDSCFTDERLELGATVALAEDIEGNPEVLADVDDVSLDDVVNRFIEQVGGDEVISTFGDSWRRDNLLRRARALQDKQRNGHIPPPTIPAHVRTPSPFAFGKLRSASLEVPDFTPAAARYAPRFDRRAELSPLADGPNRQASVPFPMVEPPFQNIPPEKPRKLPPTLLAPRYSHLLEEAVAVSQLGADGAHDSTSHAHEDLYVDEDSPEEDTLTMQVDHPITPHQPVSMGKRVKGIIFSYLPSLSKTAPQPTNRPKKGASGLPLPPPDLLEKHRSKPIITPVRPPLPRTTHPKELVNLHPAPPVEPKTSLPKREKPQRLVELNPVTPPVEKILSIPIPRPRRSSGGSVKDLVKSFEHMEKAAGKAGVPPPPGLKRIKSITEMKKGKETQRRAWRP